MKCLRIYMEIITHQYKDPYYINNHDWWVVGVDLNMIKDAYLYIMASW